MKTFIFTLVATTTMLWGFEGVIQQHTPPTPEDTLTTTVGTYLGLGPTARQLYSLRLQKALDGAGTPVPNRCRGCLSALLDRAAPNYLAGTLVAEIIEKECA